MGALSWFALRNNVMPGVGTRSDSRRSRSWFFPHGSGSVCDGGISFEHLLAQAFDEIRVLGGEVVFFAEIVCKIVEHHIGPGGRCESIFFNFRYFREQLPTPFADAFDVSARVVIKKLVSHGFCGA